MIFIHLYEIQLYNDNGSKFIYLAHENEYSNEDFKNIVEAVSIKIMKNRSMNDEDFCHFTLCNIYKEVVNYLIDNCDFIKLKFSAYYEIPKDKKLIKDLKLSLEHIKGNNYRDLLNRVKKAEVDFGQCSMYMDRLEEFSSLSKDSEFYNSSKKEFNKCKNCSFGGKYLEN